MDSQHSSLENAVLELLKTSGSWEELFASANSNSMSATFPALTLETSFLFKPSKQNSKRIYVEWTLHGRSETPPSQRYISSGLTKLWLRDESSESKIPPPKRPPSELSTPTSREVFRGPFSLLNIRWTPISPVLRP